MRIFPDTEARELGHCIRLEHDNLFGTDDGGSFYELARAFRDGGGLLFWNYA